MTKLVETIQVDNEGLLALLGQRVLLMCSNYFYLGKLIGVNTDCVLLEDAAIVYETGKWATPAYTNSETIGAKQWYVSRSAIESFGLSPKG